MLAVPSSDRHFIMYEALRKGATVDELHDLTRVKAYFIEQMKELVEEEEDASENTRAGFLPTSCLCPAKKDGFSDKYLSQLLEDAGRRYPAAPYCRWAWRKHGKAFMSAVHRIRTITIPLTMSEDESPASDNTDHPRL